MRAPATPTVRGMNTTEALTGILNTLDAATTDARKSLGDSNDLLGVQSAVDSYAFKAPELLEQLEATRTRDDITEVDRAEQLQRLTGELATLEENTNAKLANHVNSYESVVSERLLPTPPTDDPALFEARLQTARMDARMILDQSSTYSLPERMLEAATSGADPNLAWLLLATPWGASYLTGRGATDTTRAEWEAARKKAYALLLSEDQQAGHAALTHLKEAAQKIARDVTTLTRKALS